MLNVVTYTTSQGASVTQLVEYHVANVTVDGSNPFTRSIFLPKFRNIPRKEYIFQPLTFFSVSNPHSAAPCNKADGKYKSILSIAANCPIARKMQQKTGGIVFAIAA